MSEKPALSADHRISLLDAQGWSMKVAGHLDGPRGPKGWFGDLHRCVQHPRLTRLDKCLRATRAVVSIWYTDGVEFPDLAKAVEALNSPPELTQEETLMLAMVPADYLDMRKTHDTMTLLSLRDKGMIEFKDGACRRTHQFYGPIIGRAVTCTACGMPKGTEGDFRCDPLATWVPA